MSDYIDTSFNFLSDTPAGKDADSFSPTLRRYHQLLWTKPLPAGRTFTLATQPDAYLVYRSSEGVQYLSSDAITTNLAGRAARVIREIPESQTPENLGYTMGSSILFPGLKIDGKATINGARGLHPRIVDRFDLTLECIRRHYRGADSPLSPVLARYRDFFELFESFEGYVDFWLLQDLVESDGNSILFFHTFDNFTTPAIPRTVDDYLSYVRASNSFIRERNQRIQAITLPSLLFEGSGSSQRTHF